MIDLVRKAVAGNFGSDLLAGISIVTSVVLGEYLAGSIVVLMLSGGTALEEYATRRASSVLSALAKRMPRIAHRKQDDQILDVDVSQIQIGERLVVFPHEICPADGVVVEGRGAMDEAYLTGEPFLIQKVHGATVLSGALNGEGVLTIAVASLPADSRYAKIMHVMQMAEANRPQMRRIADRLGIVVHTGRAGRGRSGMDSWCRSHAFSRRAGDRHAVPSSSGYSHCDHRRGLRGCEPRHHHQRPWDAGAHRYLPHSHLR